MSVTLDQRNNFFAFACGTIEQRPFYSACQMKIRKIAAGEDRDRWPECAGAIKHGLCKASQMLDDEFLGGSTFYRDRDDCGPGIASRESLGIEQRTEAEIAEHHRILAANKEAVSDRTIPTPRFDLAPRAKKRPTPQQPAAQAPAPKPQARSSFDLGDLINAELAGA
jgi:hypothetical protein